MYTRLQTLPGDQQRLLWALRVFLVVTLVVVLAPAIVGLVHIGWLETWAWTSTLIYVASALLAIASTYVVLTTTRSSRAMPTLLLLLALASHALTGPVCCTT